LLTTQLIAKMKRIILPVLALLFINVSTAIGQIEKNTQLIGGSGFGRYDISSGNLTIYMNANYGSFLSGKICLGGELSSLSYFYDGDADGYLSMAAFIRYYFGIKEKSSFFTKFSAGPGFNFSNHNNKGISGLADLSAGHDWFLIPSVAFEASIFGNLIFAEETEGSVGLRFGLQFYLNKKNKKEDQ
jgi:hypothetical protein